jgi:hypothetical protein
MTSYTARATRDKDRFWLVHVVELDRYTQARTVAEIVPMARDLVAVLYGIDPTDVSITVETVLPEAVQRRLAHAAELREQEAALRREAADDVRAAAAELKRAGLSLRDIGKLLGVSFQRAGQLTS